MTDELTLHLAFRGLSDEEADETEVNGLDEDDEFDGDDLGLKTGDDDDDDSSDEGGDSGMEG